MRIKQLHIYQHDLPIVGEYRMSYGAVGTLDSTIIEIITDTGLHGFGETCPLGSAYQEQHALGARAALVEIAPHLIGENPLVSNLIWRKMDALLTGHLYAKAAIDIALWDLTGKAYQARVCDLLGGAIRERVPSYYAIGLESPDECARIAKEKQAQGFPRLQLKTGGRDIEIDIAAIRKVAEVLKPETRLVADANRGWTMGETISVSQVCRDVNLIIEQPCASFEEIVSLRGRVNHPVYMDESATDLNTVIRATNEQAVQGFGLKTTRVGGISAMRAIRDVCKSGRFPHTCDDTWGGDTIAAACLHLGATVEPRLCEGVWVAQPYIEEHYDKEEGVRVTNGWLDVPQKPGLGVTPDVTLFGEPESSFGD